MTVKELRKMVDQIPKEFDVLNVMFYFSYEGALINFAKYKPKHDKDLNAIVFSSPRSKYSPDDR